MFGERKINLHVTERAQAVITRWSKASKLPSPILGIKWSLVRGHRRHKWGIGFYERSEVYEGWLGIAPDFEFIVVQEWLFDRIDNATLDIDDEERVSFVKDGKIVNGDPPEGLF
jgi:hypothetical protein